MSNKRLTIIVIVLGALFFIYKLGDMFAPGSYPYAEHYEFDYPEDEVIEAINKLKADNKDLNVPKVTILNNGQFDLNDGKVKESDFWYKFYFYDKVKNQILLTWTRSSGPNTTTFAFVAINHGLDLGGWKEINDDYGYFENREIKRNFEKTILKNIKDQLTLSNKEYLKTKNPEGKPSGFFYFFKVRLINPIPHTANT